MKWDSLDFIKVCNEVQNKFAKLGSIGSHAVADPSQLIFRQVWDLEEDVFEGEIGIDEVLGVKFLDHIFYIMTSKDL